jgi:hypothetical protein
MINILEETRQHLVSFLRKTLDGNYSQIEFENFIITGYQNEVFERIRTEVVKIIIRPPVGDSPGSRSLNEDDRISIEKIVEELERQAL